MPDRITLTPEEAESVLPSLDNIHNFVNPRGILIGCDYSREEALKTIRSAARIEIGGEACRRMGHGLVVHEAGGGYSFFEAIEAKLIAIEEAKGAPAA